MLGSPAVAALIMISRPQESSKKRQMGSPRLKCFFRTLSSVGRAHIETDMYFMKTGEYKFDGTKIKEAHQWCQKEVDTMMILNRIEGIHNKIVVSNTFTQEWEMEPYLEMAEEFGYRVNSLIVENRHGNESIHGVPAEAMDRMEKRFEIKLR